MSPSAEPQPAGCTASYRTVNSWPGGFQGEVTVTAGSAGANGWAVSWTAPSGQTVSQVWNGALTTSGAAVTVANAPYNGTLAPAASTTFGFLASGTPSALSVTCTTR